MRTLLLLLSLLAMAVPLHSQLLPPPGKRVRLYAPAVTELPMIGTLGPTAGDSVRFRPQSGSWQVLSLTAIDELEVSRGRPGRALEGALVGGILGLAVGASAGSSGDCNYVCDATRLVGGALGALGGLIVGGIAGHQFKEGEERWRRVYPE